MWKKLSVKPICGLTVSEAIDILQHGRIVQTFTHEYIYASSNVKRQFTTIKSDSVLLYTVVRSFNSTIKRGSVLLKRFVFVRNHRILNDSFCV